MMGFKKFVSERSIDSLAKRDLSELKAELSAIEGEQGYRVWVWVVALKYFGIEFRHRTRRGAPFGHDMFSYFAHGFPNAIALRG